MNTDATFDPPVLTVTQLSTSIKQCLEKTFPLVALQGEISNFKPHTSGHLYFSLKDASSQIQAVMFRPDASRLQILPKDGMQVLVKGEVNVYPPAGRYQILIKEMRPVGVGNSSSSWKSSRKRCWSVAGSRRSGSGLCPSFLSA